MRSLKLRSGVAVLLESTIDNIGSLVDEVWHNWLVHWTIPWDISWLSHSVSVACLVVLMEDWVLSDSPFFVSIWNWRVSWKCSSIVPPEQIWVVQHCSRMESIIVEDNWSCESEPSSKPLWYEVVHIEVCNPASNIEVLNWKFSNNTKSKKASQLSSRGIVSPIPVGFSDWSYDDIVVFFFWEPRSQDCNVVLCFWCPGWKPFFDLVTWNTETYEIIVLNVISNLIIHHSSLTVIICVLLCKNRNL